MARFHVQRQPWQRWPRTLVCVKENDDGTTEERKYVHEGQVDRRDVLIRALWCRILSEYPNGGFPDMGMFDDELKWMGVI